MESSQILDGVPVVAEPLSPKIKSDPEMSPFVFPKLIF